MDNKSKGSAYASINPQMWIIRVKGQHVRGYSQVWMIRVKGQHVRAYPQVLIIKVKGSHMQSVVTIRFY